METFEMVLAFLSVAKSYNKKEYVKLVIYADHSGYICIEGSEGEPCRLFSFGEDFGGAFQGFVRWLESEAKKRS